MVSRGTPAADGRETWVVEPVGAAPGQGKVKSTFDEIAFLGRRTAKLIDMFRRDWRVRGILIKFKLEVGLGDDELRRVAEASRRASGADLMVANTLAMARPADGGAGGAFLLDDGGAKRVGRSGGDGKMLILRHMSARVCLQTPAARRRENPSKIGACD